MSAIFEDITATIGFTPLVRINKLGCAEAAILAKLEAVNPGGSIKDRIALAMIEEAERAGKITPETVIVEPTSGNTGIGLACVCAARGYRLVVTMPEPTHPERRKLVELLGAKVVLTPSKQGMAGAVEEAKRIVAGNQNAFMPQQFINPANPQVHHRVTAKEIWIDTDGHVDLFVAGVGTGGTITGCGQALKERNKDLKVVAVEPAASAVLSGGKAAPHNIPGLGAGFIPEVLDREIIDEIIQVSDEDAARSVKELACREGILAGISSGAAMWAAAELSDRRENHGSVIVTIFPDAANNYISAETLSQAGHKQAT